MTYVAQRAIITWFLFTVSLTSYLSLSRYMSLATSYPKVTADNLQEGYASLYKNNNDIEECRRWPLFMVTSMYTTVHQTNIWLNRKQWIFLRQSTHLKWVFIASSVAFLGTEHTNKVFLVYKQKDRITDHSGTSSDIQHLISIIKHRNLTRTFVGDIQTKCGCS